MIHGKIKKQMIHIKSQDIFSTKNKEADNSHEILGLIFYEKIKNLECRLLQFCLALKGPITTAADDNFYFDILYVVYFFFQKKTNKQTS